MFTNESTSHRNGETSWSALERGNKALDLLESLKAENQIDEIIVKKTIELDEPDIFTFTINVAAKNIPPERLDEIGFLVSNVVSSIMEFAPPDLTEGIVPPDHQPIIMQDIDDNFFTAFAFVYTDSVQVDNTTLVH